LLGGIPQTNQPKLLIELFVRIVYCMQGDQLKTSCTCEFEEGCRDLKFMEVVEVSNFKTRNPYQ